MLREEFNRLMDLFAKGASGKAIPLDEVFKEALRFFGHLNVQLQKGNDEEKKEALTMMSEMYAQINQHIKRIAENSGMSEEQLANYAENPSNFSSAEWIAMQEARNKMFQAGQSLAKSVESLNESAKKNNPQLAEEFQKHEDKKEARKKGSGKKIKKSDWNRS